MPRTIIAALAVFLATTSTAHALELGVQDDWTLRTAPADLFQAGHEAKAEWIRIIVPVGDPTAQHRIRTAHNAGFKVLLTVGGIGTRTRKPTARALIHYIRSLPRVERYTVINEPDINGITAKAYLSRWRAVRRPLGRRLLFGDFSPCKPLTFMAAIRKAGRLPKRLDVAMHPYQPNDPLAPSSMSRWAEGGIGNLSHAKRVFRAMGVKRVTWWLDEFGYFPAHYQPGFWQRAIRQAKRHRAVMLGVYMSQGPSWDTRPRPDAWADLTGRLAQSRMIVGSPRQSTVTVPDPGYYF
jgi:hypothetical protein